MRPRPTPHAAALVLSALMPVLTTACTRDRGDVRPIDSAPAVTVDSAPAPGADALPDTAIGTSPTDTVSEREGLDFDRDRVRRDGLTLLVALERGDTATIADDTSGASYRRYAYIGRARGAPFHLLRVSRFEGREYLLVHQRTGRHVVIDAPPVVSPDGARFVTAAMDLTAEFDPTRLTIWRLDADSAVREWSHEPTTWGPSDARWLDAASVAFTMNEPYEEDASRVRRRTGHVTRTAEGWVMRDGRNP